MTDSTPTYSVIIVTWNRRKELEIAINSVLRQTVADDLEIIVIDNGSTDGTVEWIENSRDDRIRLLSFDSNVGASHGRNAGILASKGRYICFLDSDAEIMSDDAIEKCRLHLDQNEKVRACTCLIWFDREKTRPFSKGVYLTPEGHYSGIRTRTQTEDPHVISSCFAVWEKELILELGGFDPWYFWGIEDVDLSLRAYHRSLRGETTASSRYTVLEDVHVLHEMSSAGRHYQPYDFDAAFHAIERQRLYLVMAYGGVGEFFRAWGRSFVNRHRITSEAWEQRLPWRKWFWLLILYPMNRLVRLPFDLRQIRRNHFEETPRPRVHEIVGGAKAPSTTHS